MQNSKFYIFMIRRFGSLKHVIVLIDCEQPLILSQDMHKAILVYLFILCIQFCNNDQVTFFMYNVL